MRCSEMTRLAKNRQLGRVSILVVTVLAASIGQASNQQAASPGIDAELQAIHSRASEILSQVDGKRLPAWLQDANEQSAAYAIEAEAIAKGAGQLVGEGSCGSLPEMPGSITGTLTFTLFASRSLGDAQLRDLFLFASGQPETQILFRGIGEDESLLDFMASLKPLLQDIDQPPTVLLDPTPFRAHGIESVPTLVATGPDGQEVARVSGLASIHWLRSALDEGKTGDLGVRGPIREIAEQDILELIHQRLARLDFETLGERAVARAFDRLPFEPLPAAGEDRERWIDPTITAGADVHLPDGTLLVRAGDSVNPLDKLPFTQRLVIFDASDSRQVAFAHSLASEASDKPTTFLLTGAHRKGGWNALTRVMELLDRRVFLLTPEMRERFALDRVPAIIEAVGRQFRVREVAMVGQVEPDIARSEME
ncbi:conjugal transfer pilus assembly protein TraW [Thiorhodovibrio litoralis]|nr:TrbC family F-type conjugative pilus assembly protein [Thiorhodovibrio winogradskyi]MBK5969337.1 conjugal transfer protein [Thiorhodovibrio winogradskyi]WPL12418.1 conjugal transfer pilus assembly protein TraW [Thiorhodovibrio litoralis]